MFKGEHIVEKKVKKETLEGYYDPFFTQPAFVDYFLYTKHGDTGLSCGNNTINKIDEVSGLLNFTEEATRGNNQITTNY